MESNDPAVKNADERLIVVGVDGSACATRAVEFAARQAAQNDASLLVVSGIKICRRRPVSWPKAR